MKKKGFKGKAIIVLMAVLFGNGMNSLARANEKTNILFIFADDWGWGDLSCHGHPYVKTPNIDRLAQEGMDFHHFVVASGVCSPSRTAVLEISFTLAGPQDEARPLGVLCGPGRPLEAGDQPRRQLRGAL